MTPADRLRLESELNQMDDARTFTPFEPTFDEDKYQHGHAMNYIDIDVIELGICEECELICVNGVFCTKCRK